MSILIGVVFGCFLIACIEVPRHILYCRKLDRQFEAMTKGMDAGRDKAWRELGVSEEDIALFYTKRAELMKEM